MNMTPPWFYTPLPGAVIWTLIDEIFDGFVDCAVNGQMGGPTTADLAATDSTFLALGPELAIAFVEVAGDQK
jgi:hypothetical protein